MDLVQEVMDLLVGGCEVEAISGDVLGVMGDGAADFGMMLTGVDAFRQCVGIVGRGEPSGFAMFDEFAGATGGTGNDGGAAEHGFDDDAAKGFGGD
jgi:hypothetical protein